MEYAQGVWSPHLQGYIKDIEKVQKRATKLIFRLQNLSYDERLKALNLPTLKYRRLRGDMIELYKMVKGSYDPDVSLHLNYSKTVTLRGNKFKLFQEQLHYDMRKYFFGNRIIHVWNSLPDEVVSAEKLDTFKNLLDKFWSGQEVVYNWKAELTGTGNRSQIS